MIATVEIRWVLAERAVEELEGAEFPDESGLRRAQMALRQALAESLRQDIPWSRRLERLEPRLMSVVVRRRTVSVTSTSVLSPPVEPRRIGRTWEEAREHKKRRHKVVRDQRLQAGLCTSCGRSRDLEGVTCSRCLQTDKTWRKSRAIREKTAEFLDDECQPLVLRFKPRMLPVLGPRLDCLREDECLTELIKACGWQDAPGSSCPAGCPDQLEPNRRAELMHSAMSRDEMV